MPFDDSKLSVEEQKSFQAGLKWALQTKLHTVAIRQLGNNDELLSPDIAETAVLEIERDARRIFDDVAERHPNKPFAKIFVLFTREVIAQSCEQMKLTAS
jgi:hypothetical protein